MIKNNLSDGIRIYRRATCRFKSGYYNKGGRLKHAMPFAKK